MPGATASATVIRVNILQTVAVYVGVPLVIYLVIALLTVVPGRAKKRARYRAGQAWDVPPQWWSGDHAVAKGDTGLATTGSEGGARGTW